MEEHIANCLQCNDISAMISNRGLVYSAQSMDWKLVGHLIKIAYVTGFAKMCIVHTSNFSTLKNHKICYEQQIDLKLARFTPLLCMYVTT